MRMSEKFYNRCDDSLTSRRTEGGENSKYASKDIRKDLFLYVCMWHLSSIWSYVQDLGQYIRSDIYMHNIEQNRRFRKNLFIFIHYIRGVGGGGCLLSLDDWVSVIISLRSRKTETFYSDWSWNYETTTTRTMEIVLDRVHAYNGQLCVLRVCECQIVLVLLYEMLPDLSWLFEVREACPLSACETENWSIFNSGNKTREVKRCVVEE